MNPRPLDRSPFRALTWCAVIVALLPSLVGATSSGTPGRYRLPATGVSVTGQALFLAIDDQLLPLRENVVEHLSRPRVREQPVLSPSRDDSFAPDQVAAHFYGAVIHDRGKFRMWYYSVGLKDQGDAYRADVSKVTQGPVCYAESDDGIVWRKPILNQKEYKGRRSNNAIDLPEELIEGVHVIRDDADPDPQRRYKMAYNAHDGTTWVFRTATSADGLRWTPAPDFAIPHFLETAGLYRFNDQYFVHGQVLSRSEGDHPGGRQGAGVVSPDFVTWVRGVGRAFRLPEPADPALRGTIKPYDQVHLGVGAASFGTVCVGFYGIWHNQPGDESSQKRWGWFGYGKISCDLGLVISNDGMNFREPVIGQPFISRHDAPATPVPGKSFPTILCQSGNGILNVGDETRIYFGRWLNADYGEGYLGEVALATLPRDRWGYLAVQKAPSHGGVLSPRGSIWSAAITLPERPSELVLNAEGVSGFSVEVADERFALLPEFSGAAKGTVRGTGGLDCPVEWRGASLASLAGRTVRFRIHLENTADHSPKLYAMSVRDAAMGSAVAAR
jgi:hypothetical protein